MDRLREVALADQLRELATNKQCFLDDKSASNPVWKYSSEAHFRREQEAIFRPRTRIAAHSSELPGPDSFIRRQAAGLPILITRDSDGDVHAFLNVCRHRGARLVDDEQGCRGRFTCPYHAWSYSNRGDLLNLPFGEQGFPDLDRDTMGLRRLACEERWGWIWLSTDGEVGIENELGGLAGDLEALAAGSLEIKASTTHDRLANWKILAEGGLEAYHFRIVHRNTIGPHFPNNLSSYQCFGDHIRSILPRSGIEQLDLAALAPGSLREHANILYTLFPLSNVLVMPDHLVWIQNEPLSAAHTRVRISTLAPVGSEDEAHWLRNDAIAQATLSEDGEIAESVQSGIDSGANQDFQFGRFEGALARFNESIDRMLAGD
jgi:phenylpropionate dioxygenase-like ring-hydroxylating dioxygenase large terminal subunit